MMALAPILASGTFLGVIPLGIALGRRLGYRRPSDMLALAGPLGVAAMSVPLAVCAVLGVFDTSWIGVAGWCTAIGATAWIANQARGRKALWHEGIRKADLGMVMLVGLAAFLYLGYPAESPLGNRDEGLYSLGGLALDRAGTLVIPRPDALAKAPTLFAPLFLGSDFFLPGIPVGSELKPQFSPVLPAWIAELHAAGGDRWLYRVNALFALGALGILHLLARQRLRPAVALLAAAVFALNPAQVWISRVNLAEPLGQLLALGGIALGVDALRSRNRLRLAAAAVLFTLSCSVRLDMAIVAPMLFAAAFAASLWGPPVADEEVRMMFRLAAATLGGQALAVAGLAVWSPVYVADNLRPLVLALAASLIFALGHVAVRHGALGWLRSIPMRKRLTLGCIAALCVAFTYAAFVRPHLAPFALIPGKGALAGLRDYREESLRNLAAYLGWPALLFALAGAVIGTARVIAGRTSPSATILVVLAIGTATVYLTAPEVSPDHFWAIRRFVTLAIPMIILMGGWGVQSLAAATTGWRYRPAMTILVVVAAASLLWAQRNTLLFRENAGLTAQLRALDATLPPGRLVVRDLDALGTTFALGFGREVLPLRDEHVAVGDATQSFWRDCPRRECTLLHASFDGLGGLLTGASRIVSLTRRYIAPTYKPLARQISRDEMDFFVTPILGVDDAPPPRNAGAARDWRLKDRGLYRDEPAPAGDARWTDGDAELMLPDWRADELQLRLASGSASLSDVRIDLDGRRLFDGRLTPGEHTLDFPMGPDAPKQRQISIRSSTFVPKDLGINADPRTLGLSIRAVRLIDSAVPMMTPSSPREAYRSAIDLPGGVGVLPQELDRNRAPLPLSIDVENRGNAFWSAFGDVPSGAPHVALGIYWTHPGRSRRLLEQRVQLPYSLRPGESLRIGVPIDARSPPLRNLPDGDYEVTIGLVYDGVAWFADRGGRSIAFPVKIAR
jgi:hypothetical protein